MLYLDNNATTTMPPEVIKSMLEWCNMGNPSAGYASAKKSRMMMQRFKEYIGELCDIDTCCQESRDATEDVRNGSTAYTVIFTSGASEGNSTMLTSVVNSVIAHSRINYTSITHGFDQPRDVKPHVVMGATEHKGLILAAESMRDRGIITVTFVQPTLSGHTLAADIEAAITPLTCIVCVMHANNETGAINDIDAIGEVAHSHGVPFHCDCVQTFGKFPLKPLQQSVDSFCVSFHKFHGPPGVGMLVIKKQLMDGYGLQPIIYGAQFDGFRGGTENLPGIGASFSALKYTMCMREQKNANMQKMKSLILGLLAKKFPMRVYTDYVMRKGSDVEIVVFMSKDTTLRYLPNTILMSVVKRKGEFMCNVNLKKYMESKGVVVSVGSACNTASPKASHVLYSMGADEYIRKGAIRVSLGDETTSADCNKFVRIFTDAILEQLQDL